MISSRFLKKESCLVFAKITNMNNRPKRRKKKNPHVTPAPQPAGEAQGKKKDFLHVDGQVLESLPAGTFRVQLENGHEVLAHLAGKLRMFHIRIMPGDRVKIEMTPYDLTKGRLVYRY